MARNFRDYWNNLMGDIPALDQFRAQDFINYAWRDIRESRRWSFLTAESSLDFPNQITAGEVSVTQFSDIVVGDPTAKAVWDALTLNMPITDRQFRVGDGPLYQILAYDSVGNALSNTWNTTGAAGALHLERTYKEESATFPSATGSVLINVIQPIDGTNLTLGNEFFTYVTGAVINSTDIFVGATPAITAQNTVDCINLNTATSLCMATLSVATVVLTANTPGTAGNSIALSLNDPTQATLTQFSGGVNNGTGYSIYKAYHSPPSTDFLSFTEVKDIQNGRNLRLDLTRDALDERDPQRQSYGDPLYVAAHKADATGEIRIELWPHLLTAKSLLVKYERTGLDFTATESLPSIIPESLLMERALCYGCRWANDNRNRYDQLKGINWQANIGVHEVAYAQALQKVRILDEEGFPSDISFAPDYRRSHGYGDTRAGQSHDETMGWGF